MGVARKKCYMTDKSDDPVCVSGGDYLFGREVAPLHWSESCSAHEINSDMKKDLISTHDAAPRFVFGSVHPEFATV